MTQKILDTGSVPLKFKHLRMWSISYHNSAARSRFQLAGYFRWIYYNVDHDIVDYKISPPTIECLLE